MYGRVADTKKPLVPCTTNAQDERLMPPWFHLNSSQLRSSDLSECGRHADASAEHPNPVTGAPRQTLLGLRLSHPQLKGHFCKFAGTGFHHTRLSVTARLAYSTFSTPFDLYGTECTLWHKPQILYNSGEIIPILAAVVKAPNLARVAFSPLLHQRAR